MAEQYPLPKFHFRVEWAGTNISFTEVTGLTVENEVIEYRAGNDKEYFKIKQAGLRKDSKITLKRGSFAGDNEYFLWWKKNLLYQGISGDRRDITIKLLNENDEPKIIWKLTQAWAPKVTYADLKADANEVAIESIELVHEGLEVSLG